MNETSPHVAPEVARGFAARLRDAVEAADRLASFVFDGEAGVRPAPSNLADGEELAAAHDFVLRAFHGASDPTNNRIMTEAAQAAEGIAVEALVARLGIPRVAVLERVNELIQLGLVARDLPSDTVRATQAGAGVAELLSELGIEVAAWLSHRKRS